MGIQSISAGGAIHQIDDMQDSQLTSVTYTLTFIPYFYNSNKHFGQFKYLSNYFG